MDANLYALASFANPPVAESTTCVKVACSTSLILSSYACFLIRLYTACMSGCLFEGAWGVKHPHIEVCFLIITSPNTINC